jgi:hypothetical protein
MEGQEGFLSFLLVAVTRTVKTESQDAAKSSLDGPDTQPEDNLFCGKLRKRKAIVAYEPWAQVLGLCF